MRTRDDVPIWSGKFERELPNMLASDDEISRGIVNSLRGSLRSLLAGSRCGGATLPGDPEAIDLFEKVITMDASFAPAYADLAGAEAAFSAAWMSCGASFRHARISRICLSSE